MKILIVLALLFCLSSAYVDYAHSVLANGTQVTSGSGNSDPAANCVFSGSYVAATNKYTGSFTCTGLSSNVTSAHIHNCDKSYYTYIYDYPYYYSSSVLLDCAIVTTSTGGSWDCTWPVDNTTSMDSICNDQCYFNVHTDNYPGGEVRGNMVSMAPACNVAGGIKLDGVAVSAGVAPENGIEVPAFYYGTFLAPVANAPGNCYFIVSWQPTNEEILLSGCCWGLPSELYSIYAYQSYDDYTSSIYSDTGLSIENNLPFSFKISMDQFKVGMMIYSKTKYVVALYSGTEKYEYAIASDGFPTFSYGKNKCVQYEPTKNTLPTTPYKCYYTTTKPDNTDTTSACYYNYEYCGVANVGTAATPDEDWDCFSLDQCYICTCGATLADLPTGGAVCCEEDGCNSGDFDNFIPAFCSIFSAGSNISFGLLVSLFVALFINWFN